MLKIQGSDIRISVGEGHISGRNGGDYESMRIAVILEKYKPTPRSRLWRHDVLLIKSQNYINGQGKERWGSRTGWEVLIGYTDKKLNRWLKGYGDNVIIPNKLTVMLEFGTSAEKLIRQIVDGKEFLKSLRQRLKYHERKVKERPADLAQREREHTGDEKLVTRYKRYNKTVIATGERRLAALEKLTTITV